MPRKPAFVRKKEIVEATLLLADRLGPERLTTMAIAKEVGVSQAAVFRHFATKQEIWNAVGEHMAAYLRGQWEDAWERGSSGIERLEYLAEAQLAAIAETPALPTIIFSRELHMVNTPLRQHFAALIGSFKGRLTDAAAQARTENTIAAEVSADDAAFLVLGVVQSLFLRWSLSGRSWDIVAEGRRLLAVQFDVLRSYHSD